MKYLLYILTALIFFAIGAFGFPREKVVTKEVVKEVEKVVVRIIRREHTECEAQGGEFNVYNGGELRWAIYQGDDKWKNDGFMRCSIPEKTLWERPLQ